MSSWGTFEIITVSRTLLREKTFMIFVVVWLTAKDLFTKLIKF